MIEARGVGDAAPYGAGPALTAFNGIMLNAQSSKLKRQRSAALRR